MNNMRWFEPLSSDKDHLAFQAVRLFYYPDEKRTKPVPVNAFSITSTRTLVVYEDFSANIREDDGIGTLSPDPFLLKERVGLKSFSMNFLAGALIWERPLWIKKTLDHKLPREVEREVFLLAEMAFSRPLIKKPKSFEDARPWQVVKNDKQVFERITNEARHLVKILDLPKFNHSIEFPTFHLGQMKPFKDFIVQADRDGLRAFLACLNDPEFASAWDVCFGRDGHQCVSMLNRESKPISAHRRLVLEKIARRHKKGV